jgi:hypothetical protein
VASAKIPDSTISATLNDIQPDQQQYLVALQEKVPFSSKTSPC